MLMRLLPGSKFRPPNGFELTGAGLAPRCNDDRREAGVRCSEGLDDAFIC
jgi:hypothetical protein